LARVLIPAWALAVLWAVILSPLSLAVTSAAELEIADDFSAYPNGSDGSPTWQPQTDTWRMRDGVYEQTDTSVLGTVSYRREPVLGDVTVSVRFRILAEGDGVRAAGIVFRSASSLREYWAHFDAANQQLLLQRQTEPTVGSERDIARVPLAISTDEWHEARVECVGKHIAVRLDGKLALEADDETFLAGKVGLRAGQGHVLFDDFTVSGTSATLDTPWEMIRLQRKYKVICEDAGAGGYEAFPDLVRLQNGDLLCVFYAGYAHVSHPNEALPNGARVCSVRSTDDGKTWGPAQVVADTPWDDRDPSVCQLPDGTVVCNWFTYYAGGPSVRPGNTNPYKEIWLARSTDNGHTWSEPELIESTANDHWACSTPIRVMPDGTLILPVYREQSRDRSYNWSAMILSSDNGRTWSEPYMVDPDNDDNDEPDIVRLPNGDLLCVMRTNVGEHTMWQSLSRDGGRTWTKSEPIGFFGQAPYLLLTSENILLLAHRNPGTSLHYSLDFGKTWSENVQIDTVGGAYPSMVEMPDGRILVVYYEEGEGSSIRAQFFRATKEGIQFEE
jgi:sialidase-1